MTKVSLKLQAQPNFYQDKVIYILGQTDLSNGASDLLLEKYEAYKSDEKYWKHSMNCSVLK